MRASGERNWIEGSREREDALDLSVLVSVRMASCANGFDEIGGVDMEEVEGRISRGSRLVRFSDGRRLF